MASLAGLTQTLFDQLFTGLKAANQQESFTKSTSN
jgi:hypothetical protein